MVQRGDLPLIGITAGWLHADETRTLYNGRPLLYLELSLGEWFLKDGRSIPVLIPAVGPGVDGKTSAADYAERLDGLVLQGGDDVAPENYGQTPLKPEWAGDGVRDEYELALIREFLKRDKPILGICRGHQILNVALGGTLYQDINYQVEGSLIHRDAEAYDDNLHEVVFERGSKLRQLLGMERGRINSVHHQAIDQVAPGLEVEARSAADGIVEAVRLRGDSYALGVQWHPEFQEPRHGELVPTKPILDDFIEAIQKRRRDV